MRRGRTRKSARRETVGCTLIGVLCRRRGGAANTTLEQSAERVVDHSTDCRELGDRQTAACVRRSLISYGRPLSFKVGPMRFGSDLGARAYSAR